MISDPVTNPAHAARQIAAYKTLLELSGYEAEAKRRGIALHEVTLIAERRRDLVRKAGG